MTTYTIKTFNFGTVCVVANNENSAKKVAVKLILKSLTDAYGIDHAKHEQNRVAAQVKESRILTLEKDEGILVIYCKAATDSSEDKKEDDARKNEPAVIQAKALWVSQAKQAILRKKAALN